MSDDKTVPLTCLPPKGLGGHHIVMEPLSGETPWQQSKPVKTENETDSCIHSGGSSPANNVAIGASCPSPGGTSTYYKSASSPPQSANLGAPAQSPPALETNHQQEVQSPLQAAADVPANQSMDDSVPTVDSHGRVKTYRCRQCGFKGTTKREFWDHMKNNHIRPEKLLECSECSFVTEYKHHLEYHLNNHKGAKPYKCDKCSYTCVNKSMLNSHMKSHSDIHQYVCATCGYATKYCHSLKIHLRKYEHQPAMVLNPDGTPNPLPIIDVYGTRRGPRTNRSSPQQQSPSQANVAAGSLPQQQPHPAHLLQVMLAVTRERLEYQYMFERLPALANPLLLGHLAAFQQQQPAFPQQQAEEPAPLVNDDGVLDLSRPERVSLRTPSVSSDSSEDEAMACNDDVQNNNCDARLSSGSTSNNYECPYCTIAFGDIVLYTMHMGYHGFTNPFTCNNCGEECGDKVSFFLHIARTPHN